MSESSVPENVSYSDSHEWIQVESDIATIGITDFAQSELGDIVFVELPEVGEYAKRGETFGTVGVNVDVIKASWNALVEAYHYALIRSAEFKHEQSSLSKQ